MIVGALVIKHKVNLSDEETILAIQENPYMQYFVGLSEFTDKPIFDSSLFVTIRKRLGTSDFNDMSVSLLILQVEKAGIAFQSQVGDKDQHPTTDYKSARGAYLEVIKRRKKNKRLINKGKSHLLSYLIRDIRSFIDLIAINGSRLFDSLKRNEKKIAGAILKMYHQHLSIARSPHCPR